MMNNSKRFLIVTASREGPPMLLKNGMPANDVPLLKSLTHLEKYNITTDDHQVIIRHNNDKGLPEIYNQYLTKKHLKEWEGIIFVHDDVYIDDPKFIDKIRKHFKQGYSVVGLAGASQAKIAKPALWHLMSERKDQAGAVAHPFDNQMSKVPDSSYVSAFGPTPTRCLIMDGLFLAIDCKKFKKNTVKFDEQFTFHHYDLDFCLECNKHQHKLVATNINVIHNSPGLLNPESLIFLESQDKFINKHAKNRS